jgi:hypothetical protein
VLLSPKDGGVLNECTLRLGHLHPADTISGAQMRLNRLGLHCGRVTGEMNALTEGALRSFQRRFKLTVDGKLGEATCKKLEELAEGEPKPEALKPIKFDAPKSGGGGGGGGGAKPAKQVKKEVTARMLSLTFRSDHLDDYDSKIIRPSEGGLKDTTKQFHKPEWEALSGKNDPISHDKDDTVVVELEIDVAITPPEQTVMLDAIKGKAADAPYLTFERKLGEEVVIGQVKHRLGASAKLPNFVTRREHSIEWTAVIDGKDVPLGTTGPHRLYVTLGPPGGKMSYEDKQFVQTGIEQDVTEERLELAVKAAEGKGGASEQECVDAIFLHLLKLGVGYRGGFRWMEDRNVTGMQPKPALHEYLWNCNVNKAKGECHNIAAAFILACRSLGVKGSFEIGFMYPWPSRDDNHPRYGKTGGKFPSGLNVQGKYNQRYLRTHAVGDHGREALMFVDARREANAFEGVAAYNGKALYAIGDDVFDKYPTADENASCYFMVRDFAGPLRLRRPVLDANRGSLPLTFSLIGSGRTCDDPYDGKTKKEFKWED